MPFSSLVILDERKNRRVIHPGVICTEMLASRTSFRASPGNGFSLTADAAQAEGWAGWARRRGCRR
jgi:hypothetical protein